MAESTTVVTLPQMVDLALNSPEVGIVNFTVLHSLLHVIVNQLELTDTNVEFRGSDSERLQGYISNAKPGPLLTLTEYTIGEPPSKKGKKRSKRSVEKGKKDEETKEKLTKKASGESVTSGTGSTVVVVESSKGNVTGPQFTIAVTKNHFEKVEEDIRKLDIRIKELTELPGNTALIQALRSDDLESTPILDMFQILTLSKRLDAAELAMEKVVSMVEDVGKQGLLAPEKSDSESEHEELVQLTERVEALEKAVAEHPAQTESEGQGDGPLDVPIDQLDFSTISPKYAVQLLYAELMKLKELTGTLSETMTDVDDIKKMLTPSADSTSENLPPEVRLNQLEIKFFDLTQQVNSLDNVYAQQTDTVQGRISDLEKEFNEIIEKIKLGLPAGDATTGMEGQSMSDMYNTLMQLQEEMTNMNETSQKLIEEREERQHALDVMLEQVELLKTVKADREDLEDALAEKADACQINKKVSLEQFDAVCEDMSKAIEIALMKLTDQEALWSQALEDIQKDVGNKLDKMELTPLRDFINKKLKHLQEKVRTLAAMKKEHEAAGTRTKFLKNVNCISCDKDVIMRKEVDSSLFPRPPALPPTRNMGPYLAYELDQLRKQQKCIPQTKNLNAFESAMQSARSAKSPDHICNRYCGGSHTVTTPQQRVTRIGHFLEQWGPEIGNVNELTIRGTDGQMYKGRDDKALKQLASEKSVTVSAGQTGQGDQTAPTSTSPSAAVINKPKSGAELSPKSAASAVVVPAQSSAGGIAGRPGTEASAPSESAKSRTSVTSKPRSVLELSTGEKPKSGTELHGEGGAEPPTEGTGSPTGTQSPKKNGSRSSVKHGSKSSLQKSASKQSAEKIEPVPEESEPPAAPSAEEGG